MKIFLGYGYTSWTTGVYWESALRKLAEVVYAGTDKEEVSYKFKDIDALNLLSEAKSDDIFLYVDSGVPYFPRNIEKLNLLTACYLIDVHVDCSTRINMAKFFDVVFIAQKDYLEMFKKNGIKNIFWIPLGCDPVIYKLQNLPKIYDIGFVGNIPSDASRRKRLINLLSNRYRMNDIKRFYSPQETSDIYNRSKIVFNCSVKGDMNMRVFEAMSCGNMLLTDYIDNGLTDLFKDRQDLVIYRNENELIKLAGYYLEHEKEREDIAVSGCNLVRNQHTYSQRTREVLEILKDIGRQKCKTAEYSIQRDAALISMSMYKIYANWQYLAGMLEEASLDGGVKIFLFKIFYLIRIILSKVKAYLLKVFNFRK